MGRPLLRGQCWTRRTSAPGRSCSTSAAGRGSSPRHAVDRGARVTGVDIDPTAVAAALAVVPGRASRSGTHTTSVRRTRRWPVRRGRGGAAARRTWPTRCAVLREAARVAAPGGTSWRHGVGPRARSATCGLFGAGARAVAAPASRPAGPAAADRPGPAAQARHGWPGSRCGGGRGGVPVRLPGRGRAGRPAPGVGDRADGGGAGRRGRGTGGGAGARWPGTGTAGGGYRLRNLFRVLVARAP